MDQNKLGNSSVDMTLALGADSFLRSRGVGSDPMREDPTGRDCFVNLVDLAINSDNFYMPQRSRDDYAELSIFVNSLSAVRPLDDCAAVVLSDYAERQIYDAFWRLVEQRPSWLLPWFASQLYNPHSQKFHEIQAQDSTRTFATISDHEWAIWVRLGGPVEAQGREALCQPVPKREYLERDMFRAEGVPEHQYAYVFGVFRRGWQYAEATRQKNMNIYYCAHRIREHALAASDGWLEGQRQLYWSWGRRLAYVIEHSSRPVEASEVVEWIDGLRKAKVKKWRHMPPLPPDGLIDDKTRKALRAEIEQLYEWAREARIPQDRMDPSWTAAVPAVALELSLTPFQRLFHFSTASRVLRVLPIGRVLDRATYSTTEMLKDATNLMFKSSTFGHPGLVGPALEDAAAPSRRDAYLL